MSAPNNTPSPNQPRRLVGYARVSTEDQANDAQV
jgi:predicted site-specific integrase-resolvase